MGTLPPCITTSKHLRRFLDLPILLAKTASYLMTGFKTAISDYNKQQTLSIYKVLNTSLNTFMSNKICTLNISHTKHSQIICECVMGIWV